MIDMVMHRELKLLWKWWKTWKTIPVYSWVKAAVFYREGKFLEAEKAYQKGLRSHPEHPAGVCARLDMAFCQFRLRKLEEAEANLRAVTTMIPTSKEAHLRLSRLQIWMGQPLEAAWSMRRSLLYSAPDPDIAATFLLAVLENNGPQYLLDEALEAIRSLHAHERVDDRLRTAMALYNVHCGRYDRGMEKLALLVRRDSACFEAVVGYGELLLRKGSVSEAIKEFRSALKAVPEYPRVLSLLAESYLAEGEHYAPDYACQLATLACQNSCWKSPREMHVLAKAHLHLGDRVSSLMIASKAKAVGSRLLGTYRDQKPLEALIESLSSGTLA